MKGDHESTASQGSSGIAFTDEESMMSHLDNLCSHIRSMIDIIHTLTQFSKLVVDVRQLPRVSKEVVLCGPMSEGEEQPAGENVRLNTGDAGVSLTVGGSLESGSEYSYPVEGGESTNQLIIFVLYTVQYTV